jgi:hypothetical protein
MSLVPKAPHDELAGVRPSQAGVKHVPAGVPPSPIRRHPRAAV